MTEKNNKSEKSKRIAYWVSTGLLTFGMLSGGIAQLIRAEVNVDGIVHLGYPLYFMTILGTWKILGVIALLIPGYSLLKEWAYAGFFFAMTGAVTSHLIVGDGPSRFLAPLFFAVLIILSWYLRPNDRLLIKFKN